MKRRGSMIVVCALVIAGCGDPDEAVPLDAPPTTSDSSVDAGHSEVATTPVETEAPVTDAPDDAGAGIARPSDDRFYGTTSEYCGGSGDSTIEMAFEGVIRPA